LSYAAENDFLKFKGRGPLKFSKKYPAAKHYTDIYQLVLLLTHLNFRWTVPLIWFLDGVHTISVFLKTVALVV
jgi:hypothetical protein